MSVLVVGLSHRSAPGTVLERVALDGDGVVKLLADLNTSGHVDEAVVVSTCNRVEVYAEVSRFHGGVQEVSELLARSGGLPLDALAPHLYVHYEDSAVQHLFTVTAGLDSMVVGESQVLGQVRGAFRLADEEGTVGRVLRPLLQHALHAGKRAHAETGIDAAGPSVVDAALGAAGSALGALAGRHALVVGAGSMGALAVSLLRRAGVGELVVANRTPERAHRLAAAYGGRGTGLDELVGEIAGVDLLLCSTGATGVVVPAEAVEQAMRTRPGRPLAVVDLALPRDVEAAAAAVPGVTLVDLAALGAAIGDAVAGPEIEAAQRIVTDEVGAYLASRRSSHVAPTVVALRAKAAEVVAAELGRLDGRLPGLDPRAQAEVATTVRRVVDKLLHSPTVRVKELADQPGGQSYAAALRELFDLDPAAPEAVSRAAVRVDEVDGVTQVDEP